MIAPGVAEVTYRYKDDALEAFKKYNQRNLDGRLLCVLVKRIAILSIVATKSFVKSCTRLIASFFCVIRNANGLPSPAWRGEHAWAWCHEHEHGWLRWSNDGPLPTRGPVSLLTLQYWRLWNGRVLLGRRPLPTLRYTRIHCLLILVRCGLYFVKLSLDPYYRLIGTLASFLAHKTPCYQD